MSSGAHEGSNGARSRSRASFRHVLIPALVAALQIATGAQQAWPQRAIAITNVSIVDGTTDSARAGQTVVVTGKRITAVGRRVPVPGNADVVDGTGRYLIPGLWDMHVHMDVPAGREVLPLYVLHGVTGVRDMAGEWPTIQRWKQEIAAGRLVGPRIVASGPYIEGGDVPIPHILARTPTEAVAAVDSLAKLGVDFVKLHSQFRRDVFFAAARRARERRMVVTGHVPRSVTAIEASDSGLRSIEHLLQIPSPCTPAESLALLPRFVVQGALNRCSSAPAAPIFERLRRNATWVVPTLVAQYEVAHWPATSVPGDAFSHYLPDTLRRFVASIFPMPADVPPDADIVGRALFAKRMAAVDLLSRAGVGIMTGTDAPLRNSPPGAGLHEEMQLLARSGMSNIDVIRAATIEPARYFSAPDTMGTVAPGMVADLVLLDANPLVDIANVSRISAVIWNGRLISGAERAALLRSMSARGARPPGR
ncbi:MAG: amidohydrolase family protein [Gemmatimonadota bacterium]